MVEWSQIPSLLDLVFLVLVVADAISVDLVNAGTCYFE